MKLLKFGAPWCHLCKMLTAQIKDSPLGIEVVELNIEDEADLVKKYKVRGVPTCVLVNNNNEQLWIWREYTTTLVENIRDEILYRQATEISRRLWGKNKKQ